MFTYTVPFYSVNVAVGGGWMGAMGGTIPTRSDQNWPLDKCYPFAKKDSHKKTSCKALVMAHAYSNVVMDKIEECIKNGLSGNENDNWLIQNNKNMIRKYLFSFLPSW